MSKANGKRYGKEFKLDAIRLVNEGRKAKDVAEDLGVCYQTLMNWIKKDEERKIPELCRIKELEALLKEKEKRIEDLEETTEILKKAAAIFVKDNQNQSSSS